MCACIDFPHNTVLNAYHRNNIILPHWRYFHIRMVLCAIMENGNGCTDNMLIVCQHAAQLTTAMPAPTCSNCLHMHDGCIAPRGICSRWWQSIHTELPWWHTSAMHRMHSQHICMHGIYTIIAHERIPPKFYCQVMIEIEIRTASVMCAECTWHQQNQPR